MVVEFNRKLILETGEEYCGYAFGAAADRVFDAIFNTSMVGYQEIITDPSYAGQGIVMTYPLIGNYGIADDDFESRGATVGALIVREYNDQPSNFRFTKTLGEVLEEYGIPGIYGLDTRKLTRDIRDNGSKRALITGMETSVEEGLKIIASTPAADDMVAQVSCRKRWHSRIANHKYNVVAIDCGIKLSLIRSLNARGCNVTVVPCSTSAEEILALHPDGIVVSNGPGNPENAAEIAQTINALRGKVPMFGTGLGHQLIAMAYGAKTYKLACGHHGSNLPVRETATGSMETYIQNHSYAVAADSIEGTGLTVTYTNVIDHSVEGVECAADQVFSVQFNPTDAEGPKGRICQIDKFVTMMKEAKTHA
jgi:carbamoyl-phosphate synthase small subunit